MGSILKGKDFLPKGSNTFLLELTPFWKGPILQESKQVVIKGSIPLNIHEA